MARHKRRSKGSIRKLPSGRYQVRVRNPATNRLQSIGVYGTSATADAVLRAALTDQSRGVWVDPKLGDISLRAWSEHWMRSNPKLAPRTVELYESELRRHILPTLGDVPINKLTTSGIRVWWSDLLGPDGPGATTVAKTYRLLAAMLNTAVVDEVIVKNPCRIKGAAQETAPERPVLSITQVYGLLTEVPDEWKAMVLLATFTTLRFGELRGLRNRCLDLMHAVVAVQASTQDVRGAGAVTREPKQSSFREVSIPEGIVAELQEHLDRFAEQGPGGYVFPGAGGGPFRRATFYSVWHKATANAGLDGFHFHDLRHTGNTLAADTGASTRQLMQRMGHRTERAALIYQHATREGDENIASRLSAAIAERSPDHRAPVVRLRQNIRRGA